MITEISLELLSPHCTTTIDHILGVLGVDNRRDCDLKGLVRMIQALLNIHFVGHIVALNGEFI